jgi:hypothetical protein
MTIADLLSSIEKEAENTERAGKVEWFLQGTLYGQLRTFEPWEVKTC